MSHYKLVFSTVLLLTPLMLPVVHLKDITCAQHVFNVSFPMFGELVGPGMIHCRNCSCCVAAWSQYNGELQTVVLSCYPNVVCLSKFCKPEWKRTHYKCVCSSNMCNANITPSHQPISIRCRGLSVRREESQEFPSVPVDGLSFTEQVLKEGVITSQLCLGILHGRDVVIKCFPPELKGLSTQEWKILSLLTPLRHKNIVCLLAAGSGHGQILEQHQLLVLKYYPQGSLRSYLTQSTSDWATTCQMAISLAKGLAFLHEDKNKDVYKPAIAHRDLSSDNILVAMDSTCVISDFGLSVVLEGYQIMNRKALDPAMISMTGTLRYMPPEMLDGSLNLISWELALTQADVYSFGLILWEIFSRCDDLYTDNHHAPEFQVVFSKELGLNPTLDKLQSFVVENKRRPELPSAWDRTIQPVRALWETLEDCWDPDSEARLTAQCAEQRLNNFCPYPSPIRLNGRYTTNNANVP
ncbi:hypothetical protein GDO86_004457 [Hymenochirus boettgeri]|uniref:receptor protein serine/threonine kinase n=1 Tax=Hymenochirus boettgeri TaxID=247094 RepID=A0A8T2K8D7_9PIPI|nr:hypothetical protein GDO86_004457 [Hymenochirus boettgeri]